MDLGSVQNSIGRSFEVQAMAQQAILAGELATRQTERQLAREHTRQESQVSAQSAAQPEEGLDVEHAPQQPDPRRSRKRYGLKPRPEGPVAVVIISDDPAPASPHQKLDIIA